MRTRTIVGVGAGVLAGFLLLPGCGGDGSAAAEDAGSSTAEADAATEEDAASHGNDAAPADTGTPEASGDADGAGGGSAADASTPGSGGARTDGGSHTDPDGNAHAGTGADDVPNSDGGSDAQGDAGSHAHADGGSDAQGGAVADAGHTPSDGGALAAAGAANNPVSLCAQWERDLGTETQWTMNAWGFERAETIFEGRIGEVSSVEDSLSRATVTVQKVWFGWGHFEGHTVAVDIDPAWLAALGDADTVIFGVQRSYPLEAENGQPPRFDFVEAAVPASEMDLFPGRIGYHATEDEWIGVARMTENDGEWQRFEVVETLSGSPLDRFEYHFVPFEGVPLPSVSDTEYLIAGTQTGYSSVSPDFMRIDDFRVATDEARTLVEAGLTSPPEPIAIDRLGEAAERYRAGWLFALSNHVVSAQVSGVAAECCTNAGGSYAAYDVVDRYRGAESVTGLSQFFRGVSSVLACGEGYLFGFDQLSQVTPEQIESGFACDVTGRLPVNPEVPFSEAMVTLPMTAENTRYVQEALESAGPLYRLYNLDETVDPSSFRDEGSVQLWSAPLDIMDGISAAEQMVRLEVENVSEHDGWTEVRIAMCLATTTPCSSEAVRLKLALPCGDTRLKQVGSAWLAGLIDPAGSTRSDDGVIEPGKAFLVPGVLVPTYFGRLGQRL
jgi:hypothetical protein